MGCDIHLFLEKKVRGKWVCLNPLEWDEFGDDSHKKGTAKPYTRRKLGSVFSNRNYYLFGWLAQVRCDQPNGFEAKGFPKACSKVVRERFKEWGVDAHTPSFLTLAELEAKFSGTVIASGMMNGDQLHKLKKSIDIGSPDWSLLYPHCGETNMIGHVKFELDVPLKWLFKRFYERVVRKLDWHSFFDKSKKEGVRIVFWFDN